MILESYIRIFVEADEFDKTRTFYRTLLNGSDGLYFNYPEKGLTLASVVSPKLSVLIIAGPVESREPFVSTALTLRVDALEPTIDNLLAQGARQLEPIQKTPIGRKTRFRHNDGLTVEYVEYDDAAAKGWTDLALAEQGDIMGKAIHPQP
jgi:hypothetical protein